MKLAILMVALFAVTACKAKDEAPAATGSAAPAEGKPAEAKPAEAKPAEVKPAEVKPAEAKPAEGGVTIANDAELEAKVLEGFEGAHKILMAGVKGDCDKLAAEITKFNEDQLPTHVAIAAYERDHKDAYNPLQKKIDPHLKDLEKKAEPTFAHCKGNQAFLKAVTSPPEVPRH